MDEQEPESSGLTGDFNATHRALVVEAKFTAPKVASGKIFVLENDRIEPTAEDKAKQFGLSPEELEALPEDAREALKEEFIETQIKRLDDAHDRLVVTYENYLSDAEHALIEVRDIALSSLEAELTLAQDTGVLKGSSAQKVEGAYEKVRGGASAEVALDAAYEDYMDIFRSMDNPYFRKTLTELEQQRATMQHHLHPDKKLTTLDNIEEGTILASVTFPLYALSSFRDHETGKVIVNGAITDAGSLESHGAILIGSMGIPYARVAADDMQRMKNGDVAIMDGPRESILLHPNKVTLGEYEVLVDSQHEQTEALLKKSAKKKTVTTTDGVKINVHANFAVSDEAHDLKAANPVGIGLYRTEIAASMRENKISAGVWRDIFKQNMAASDVGGKGYVGTTIRTIDLAGDKSDLPKAQREELQEKMTREQMRGLLMLQNDLAEEGHKSKLKVMVPTISSIEEMKSMQKMMDEQAEDLGVKSIKLGCMVEVPSLITELRKLDVEFMSVGTNDLIHELLGINRYDSESIKKYDPTNPAVLKALDETTSAGEENNTPVSICGNMASDPRYTALLIGAGYTNMSAGIDSIPVVKEMASRVNSVEARHLFETLCDTETRADREAILSDFNARLGLAADGRLNMKWEPPELDWIPEVQ